MLKQTVTICRQKWSNVMQVESCLQSETYLFAIKLPASLINIYKSCEKRILY